MLSEQRKKIADPQTHTHILERHISKELWEPNQGWLDFAWRMCVWKCVWKSVRETGNLQGAAQTPGWLKKRETERAPGEGSLGMEQLEENKFEVKGAEGYKIRCSWTFLFFPICGPLYKHGHGWHFKHVTVWLFKGLVTHCYGTKNTERDEKRYSILEILV